MCKNQEVESTEEFYLELIEELEIKLPRYPGEFWRCVPIAITSLWMGVINEIGGTDCDFGLVVPEPFGKANIKPPERPSMYIFERLGSRIGPIQLSIQCGGIIQLETIGQT